MLLDISIRHFMLIDSLDLSLEPGMLALTGETGAGKSILLNALAMGMGARADKKLITPPESEHADITLSFDIQNNPQAQTWLKDNGYDNGLECVIRRRFNRDGQSRYAINGQTAALGSGRELAAFLLHIHSQHQQQSLKQNAWQLSYLDQRLTNQTHRNAVVALANEWHDLQSQIDTLSQHQNDHSRDLALLNYQLTELDELNLQTNEWEEKHKQHQQIHQAKQIIEHLDQAMQHAQLNPQANAQDLLQEAMRHIKQIAPITEESEQILQLFDTALIQIQEAHALMQNYLQRIDSQQESLDDLEKRLSNIHDVARKHQCKPEQLYSVHEQLAKHIAELSNADERIVALKEKQSSLASDYQKACEQLCKQRQQTAKKITSAINGCIADLNMPGCRFSIDLETRDTKQPHKDGLDTVRFMLQSQPKQPAHPVAQVASGGELSRLSLALMLHTCKDNGQPTYIFDEIDVGISGETAKLVGQKLRELGTQAHVLCVTHLPNVAALANAQYQVIKTVSKQGASTHITPLSQKERIQALAEMASGKSVTQANLDHAKALLTG